IVCLQRYYTRHSENLHMEATLITVAGTVHAPADKVWDYWTSPAHIAQWNSPSPEWYTSRAVNDLQPGGTFSYRMEARDGSLCFDFEGTFNIVEKNKRVAYTISDGRKVNTLFIPTPEGVYVETTFEAESTHTIEQQQFGWQAIQDSFKQYVESH
ncbi:MAG TPA: SRPBCC domain-containing protein, partial [Chitinophaga sp.]